MRLSPLAPSTSVAGRTRRYGQRLGIIEPVFGNLRAQKRMDRFTRRAGGRAKVTGQWRLYCLVHNLEKLAKYGTSWN
jgi:hypothetical protein